MEILKTQNLSFSYPNSDKAALDNISVSINQGEFITLCGRSGSGKSTFLRQLKPALAPHGSCSGDILLEGRELKALSHREQSERIGFVMQSPENQIVTDKVWHELAFGLESLGLKSDDIRSRVAEMASFFGIEGWFHKKTAELSGGQKQLLNLASVMVMQPQILLLDEPTGQLDPIAAGEFLQALARLNRELGTTIIMSEHRLEEAFSVSGRAFVMDEGALIFDGTPGEAGEFLSRTNHSMSAALPVPMRVFFALDAGGECPVTVREGRDWLGKFSREHTVNLNFSRENPPFSGEPVIRLEDVWFRYDKSLPDVAKGLTMEVMKGELYAVLGGNGAGKTTMLSVMGNLLRAYSGKVKTEGKAAILPQDPKVLFTGKTVAEDLAEMGTDISPVVNMCELHGLMDKHPYDLSGGEQQRAALAKVLLTKPDILLLDEPTKGLDGDFKLKFAGILRMLKSTGVTIVMVTHDIEFCARYADRCAMFFDGKIVSCSTPAEFFSGKSFYTTAAARMARDIIPRAVLAEDIIRACGGKAEEEDAPPSQYYDTAPKTKPAGSKRKIHPFTGALFLILFAVVQFTLVDRYEGWINIVGQIFSIVFSGAALMCFVPCRAYEIGGSAPLGGKDIKVRAAVGAAMILLLVPLTVLYGIYFLGDRKYYFISLLIIFETLLPFVIMFEKKRPQARELILISVMCAVGVAGRQAFFALPQFKPVLAIVIITGVCFGGEAGFLTGAITAFVSNFFISQGPWTPWQMFATGIVGFFAGVLFRSRLLPVNRLSLCVYGGLATVLIYGGILNPASVIMWNTAPTADLILSACLVGLPMDIVHGVSTVFFLWLASEPLIEKLNRIKLKYGI